jgi:hypothetical protein
MISHEGNIMPKSVNNRKTVKTVMTLKKWWVESDFKVPNLPLSFYQQRQKSFSLIRYLIETGCHST